MTTMSDEKEVIVIDNSLLSAITKKIVRLERDNATQQEKTDSQMEEIIKRVIDAAVP